jgi:hypothetical protein
MEKPHEFRADVIEVTVSGSFKTEHVFNAADGVLGVLNLNAMISEGTFRGADGSELTIKNINFWKPNFQMIDGDRVLGKAHSPKVFKRAFEIEFDGQSLRLESGGSKLRSWSLLDAAGSLVCEFRPRGAFKRGALIQICAAASLGLLAFAYTMVSRRWQEENTAAA